MTDQKVTKAYEEIHADLIRPFHPDHIKFLKSPKGVFPYADVRHFRSVLNSVDPAWQSRMELINDGQAILCHLTIKGVTRSDVGDASGFASEKGAASDAIKRAGFNHGLGEFLYAFGDALNPSQGKYKEQYIHWLIKEGIDTYGCPIGFEPTEYKNMMSVEEFKNEHDRLTVLGATGSMFKEAMRQMNVTTMNVPEWSHAQRRGVIYNTEVILQQEMEAEKNATPPIDMNAYRALRDGEMNVDEVEGELASV